jgi:hypothetical protein
MGINFFLMQAERLHYRGVSHALIKVSTLEANTLLSNAQYQNKIVML